MRVLLPLKKKQDDPNSQDPQYVEEHSYIEGEAGETYVEATAEAAETELAAAAVDVDSAGTEGGGGEAWTEIPPGEASPTAVLLSAAAARLSCLPPQPSSPTSSEGSSSFPSSEPASLFVDTRKAAGLNLEEEKRPDNPTEVSQESEEAPGQQQSRAPQSESTELPEKKTEKQGSFDAKVKTAAVAAPPSPYNTTTTTLAEAPLPFGSGTLAIAATAAPSSVASLSTGAAKATPSTTPTATPATSTRAARKRRSSSPPSCLDLKPPSKKVRDTKPPPAIIAADAKSVPTTEAPLTTTPDNKEKMAGGRGGHKVWTGAAPTYYVETTNGGREDVATGEDGAELDVRFTYRHENDPSSARGDAPSLRAAAPPSNNNNNSHNINSHNNSNELVVATRNNQNSSFYDNNVCGRDDEDVRERESSVDGRPEGAAADDENQQFAVALKKQGLEIVEQEGDGNCLFRAISLQVYGDASMHGEVRQRCLDFMARDKEHFSQFITDEPFEQYIRRKRQDGVHGNNPEIQAISELFNRPIEVFVPENGASPLNIFHAEYKTQDAPIRLSYHDGNHYNAVIDPLVPTAGLGLGLPGLQPGLADKMQMAKAKAESDRLEDQREYELALKESRNVLEESQNDQLQRAIKESTLSVDHLYQNKALSLSDCDATNFELEQAVLESSLESFRTFEHGRKQASKASSGRRKRQASPPQKSNVAAGAFATSSSVASIPREARQDGGGSGIPSAASAASASPSVASAPAVASRPSNDEYRSSQLAAPAGPMMAEHYPQTVQELVMNGFELRKVVHAYELVGDNFDDLLGFLMSNSGS